MADTEIERSDSTKRRSRYWNRGTKDRYHQYHSRAGATAKAIPTKRGQTLQRCASTQPCGA